MICSKTVPLASLFSGSSSNLNSPLGRAIALPCPAEDVCELKFSEMNGLYVVAKPRRSDSTNGTSMYVYVWALTDDRRIALPVSPIKHDVCMGLSCPLMILIFTGSRASSRGLVHKPRSIQQIHGICANLTRETGNLPCPRP
jgi:hypothetical protein